MDMRRLVGRNVRRARDAAGLSQEKLAEAADLSQQYLSSLETGRRNPTVLTLYFLAEQLNVRVTDLVAPDPEALAEPSSPAPRPRKVI